MNGAELPPVGGRRGWGIASSCNRMKERRTGNWLVWALALMLEAAVKGAGAAAAAAP